MITLTLFREHLRYQSSIPCLNSWYQKEIHFKKKSRSKKNVHEPSRKTKEFFVKMFFSFPNQILHLFLKKNRTRIKKS